MNYTNNYNLNKPELAEQFNLDDWNDNSDTIDSALAGLQNLTDQTFKTALLNFCYPVGSLYWSSNSTNPAQLFGGTWTQIKDKFIWAKGDSDTVNATGGAKTVTLTEANLPSHRHTLTPEGSITITTNPTFTGTNKTISMSGTHNHKVLFRSTGTGQSKNVLSNTDTGTSYSTAYVEKNASNQTYIESTTQTLSGTYKPEGSISGGDYKFNGTAGTTSPVGSGTAVNKMPPYIVKYCWERTA